MKIRNSQLRQMAVSHRRASIERRLTNSGLKVSREAGANTLLVKALVIVSATQLRHSLHRSAV